MPFIVTHLSWIKSIEKEFRAAPPGFFCDFCYAPLTKTIRLTYWLKHDIISVVVMSINETLSLMIMLGVLIVMIGSHSVELDTSCASIVAVEK